MANKYDVPVRRTKILSEEVAAFLTSIITCKLFGIKVNWPFLRLFFCREVCWILFYIDAYIRFNPVLWIRKPRWGHKDVTISWLDLKAKQRGSGAASGLHHPFVERVFRTGFSPVCFLSCAILRGLSICSPVMSVSIALVNMRLWPFPNSDMWAHGYKDSRQERVQSWMSLHTTRWWTKKKDLSLCKEMACKIPSAAVCAG